MINPLWFLLALVGLTIAGLMIESVRRRRQIEAIRSLAQAWRMNFARRDTLRLTARVAGQLPLPGAAALRIFHVVYGTSGESYRYIFTLQYTLGVTGSKRRYARVATFTEPRDRRRGGETVLTLGEEDATLIEQYEALGARTDIEPRPASLTHTTSDQQRQLPENPSS